MNRQILLTAPITKGKELPRIEYQSKLEEAELFAKGKHRHQLRKDDKTLYWVHLELVVDNLRALGIQDEDIMCAGWLHDTIEDTDTDYDDLAKGFDQRVADIVASVTKDKSLPEEEKEKKYVGKLRNAPWEAHVVKLCDIWANLADLDSGYKDDAGKIKQIKKKLRYFDAIKSKLAQNSDKIPALHVGIDEINKILARYAINPVSL